MGSTKDKVLRSKKEVATLAINMLRNNVQSLGGLYLSWIGLHYAASHLYTRYCTPYGLEGFIKSPFLAVAPHCTALRWGIDQGALTINNMWLVIAAWVAARLTVKPKQD